MTEASARSYAAHESHHIFSTASSHQTAMAAKASAQVWRNSYDGVKMFVFTITTTIKKVWLFIVSRVVCYCFVVVSMVFCCCSNGCLLLVSCYFNDCMLLFPRWFYGNILTIMTLWRKTNVDVKKLWKQKRKMLPKQQLSDKALSEEH